MIFQLLGNHGTLTNTVLGQVVVTALTYHDLPFLVDVHAPAFSCEFNRSVQHSAF